MKAFKLTISKPPRSTGSGVYGFDCGDVCFNDIVEIVATRSARKEKAAINQRIYAERRKERHEKRSAKSDFHRKHG